MTKIVTHLVVNQLVASLTFWEIKLLINECVNEYTHTNVHKKENAETEFFKKEMNYWLHCGKI